MKPTPRVYLPLLDRALESEIGITVETNEPKLLRHEILAAKRDADDPRYDELITFLPADRNEVFICRKSAELPD